MTIARQRGTETNLSCPTVGGAENVSTPSQRVHKRSLYTNCSLVKLSMSKSLSLVFEEEAAILLDEAMSRALQREKYSDICVCAGMI